MVSRAPDGSARSSEARVARLRRARRPSATFRTRAPDGRSARLLVGLRSMASVQSLIVAGPGLIVAVADIAARFDRIAGWSRPVRAAYAASLLLSGVLWGALVV